MEWQISMPCGEVLEIPPRLFQDLQGAVDAGTWGAGHTSELADTLLRQARQQGDSEGAVEAALKAAVLFQRQQEPEQVVLCLTLYATKRAGLLISAGELVQGLGLLADALQLAHHALACSRPGSARELAQILADTTEEAVALGTISDSVSLFAAADDIAAIFAIVSTIWGPDLESEIERLMRLLPALSAMAADHTDGRPQRVRAKELLEDLHALRGEIAAKRGGRDRVRDRRRLFGQLADAWYRIVQRQTLSVATTSGGAAESMDADNVAREAEDLIGEVEQRLRALIVQEYERQFGGDWVQEIRSKHSYRFNQWMRNMQRDQSAFETYDHYSPQILDYARLADLADIVATQWRLFRRILDFGYKASNKAVFRDKMKHIAKVRNPLAHHRPVPENELLRVKVYCTDILMALDRAARASERSRAK